MCGVIGEAYPGVQEYGAVLGPCTAMLTNCKSVAEQLMDCTNVYTELLADCSRQEIKLITELVKTMKDSMRKLGI